MPSFSQASKDKLSTCDTRLRTLMDEAIKRTDFTVLCGYRGKEDQDKAFAEGKSKLRFPNGQHNKLPSRAVDIAPYPIDWNDIQRFKDTAEIIKEVAAELGIDVEWGGNWTHFKDYPHWEIATGK